MITLILPTYNERENIESVVKKIMSTKARLRVIIIDDNSPDGTGEIADRLSKKYKAVYVIHRKNEHGLGSAIKAGLEMSSEITGVMDADMSHDASIIPQMIKELENGADFVIGSRYTKNGKIDEWGLYRRFVSKIATFIARPLTHVKDPLSGYFFVRKGAIDSMKINPESCKICLDIIVRGKYNKIVEIPYTFVNRKAGKSKILNSREILKYAKNLLYLYYYKLLLAK